MVNWFDVNRIMDGPCEKCWNRFYHYHTCADYDASLDNDLVTFEEKEKPVEAKEFEAAVAECQTIQPPAQEVESPLEQVIRRWEANRDFKDGTGVAYFYTDTDLFRDLLIMVDQLQGEIRK